MRTAILAIALAAGGCTTGHTTPARYAFRPTVELTNEDLKSRPDAVPEKEAEQVVATSFPGRTAECRPGATKAWVKSSIRGAFEAPRTPQTMYFVRTYECDGLPSAHQDELVVYQGGREVWRTPGREPVRAEDLDGDGKDEWIEVQGTCDPECGAEAWARGYENGVTTELAHLTRE